VLPSWRSFLRSSASFWWSLRSDSGVPLPGNRRLP